MNVCEINTCWNHGVLFLCVFARAPLLDVHVCAAATAAATAATAATADTAATATTSIV